MKKIALSLLLSAVAGNSFAMDQQYMVPCQQNKLTASLILAGLGYVGVSMWYASRKDNSRHQLATYLTMNGGVIDNGIFNVPPRTIGAIAPLIPAVFCFWYGFKNLNS